VILVDANLLIYAYNAGAPQHEASRRWLEEALSGGDLVRFAWVTIWAFIRITTNHRAFTHPLSTAEACTAVAEWLGKSNAGILEPGERHLGMLGELLDRGQAAGPLVADAVLAALAIEHGATLCSTDRDFARFPGLDWNNPIESRQA
jgi:toxin-antitoxin system PIN domain toxin